MAFVYTLDDTVPANTSFVRDGAGNIRDFKAAMIERVESFFNDVNADPWTVKDNATIGNVNVKTLTPVADATYALGDSTHNFTNVNTQLVTVKGATITASAPALNVTQTWNAGGVTFTGVLVNITDTASAAASLLVDYQVATISKFKVTKGGALTTTGAIRVATTTPQIFLGPSAPAVDGGGVIAFNTSNAVVNWQIDSNSLVGATLSFTPSTTNGGNTFTTPAFKITASGIIVPGTTSVASTVTSTIASGAALIINNNAEIRSKTSGGTAFTLLYVASDDNTYLHGPARIILRSSTGTAWITVDGSANTVAVGGWTVTAGNIVASAGNLSVSNAGTNSTITLNSNAAAAVYIEYQKGATAKWQVGAGISDASSTFQIRNAGGGLPFTIDVTSNTVFIGNGLDLTGAPPAATASHIAFGGSTRTTIGANGAASALTALPLGYYDINVAGTIAQVPYYNRGA